jgi:hypothetical protein
LNNLQYEEREAFDGKDNQIQNADEKEVEMIEANDSRLIGIR